MSTEKITATNYAADRFARLEATLAKDGLRLAGDSGEAKDHGADVVFGYDAASQTLTVTILHGPHLHDFQAFCDRVKAFIEDQQ